MAGLEEEELLRERCENAAAALTHKIKYCAHNACNLVWQVHGSHLAYHRSNRFFLVFEKEELAVQQRLDSGNGRLSLDNVPRFRHFERDLVHIKP